MLLTRITAWLSKHRRNLLWAIAVVLTTFLYVVAFPPVGASEAAFVCLVPLAFWLRSGPSYKSVALTSFAIGWVSWIILIFWLHHVTWVGMLLLAGAMGVYFTIWSLGVAWLTRRLAGRGMFSGIPLTLGAAALWVVVEHLRGWFLSGFAWLPLSASQWSQPIMLQSAAYFGAWSISFILVALNFGVTGYLVKLIDYARTRKRTICPEFYLSLALMVGLTFMMLRGVSGQEREHAFKAAVVQPAISQQQKWDSAYDKMILDRLEHQTLSLMALKPDAVFWPEAVLPYPINDDGIMESWSNRLADRAGVPIFAGALGIEKSDSETKWYNSVFLVRPEYGLFPRYYSKRHLVPFGEYIPFRSLWPWVEKFVPIEGDILPGTEPVLLPLDLDQTTIQMGPLVCFEDVFPGLARSSVQEGAGLLFVATNSAWYGQTGASSQHMAHSVLRAVETRRVVLRVGNDGMTCWVDEYGNLIRSLDLWEQQWTAWDITRDRRWVGKSTFYVENGNWFVWCCWGIFAVCALVSRGLGVRGEARF